jgi:hypothetical protein
MSNEQTPQATPTGASEKGQEAPATVLTESPKAEAAADGKVAGTEAPQEKPKEVVPEKYELKVPDGSSIDATEVEKVSAFAKAKGLSNDQAQLILEQRHDAAQAFANTQQEKFKETAKTWVEQLKTDKEVGGEGFAKNVELARRVLNKFGSDNLKTSLDESGLGNHPELVKLLWKVGQKMGDDELVMPGASAGKTPMPLEERFYGSNSNG